MLTLLVEREGSDLRVGEPPILRIHGELTRTEFPPLTPEDTRELVISIRKSITRSPPRPKPWVGD